VEKGDYDETGFLAATWMPESDERARLEIEKEQATLFSESAISSCFCVSAPKIIGAVRIGP
jgi:hypothetical protein